MERFPMIADMGKDQFFLCSQLLNDARLVCTTDNDERTGLWFWL